MAVEPITRSALGLDLSPRILQTNVVVGSPAAAAETTVASLTIPANVAATSGVFLFAWCAFTVGTNGVTANLKIHHTDSAGATLAATGATTVVATNLVETGCQGVDAVPVLPGQIYIATLTIGSGSAASTVSGVSLVAIVV